MSCSDGEGGKSAQAGWKGKLLTAKPVGEPRTLSRIDPRRRGAA